MSTVLDAAAEMKADDAVEVDLEKLKFDDAEEGKGCSSHHDPLTPPPLSYKCSPI